MTTATARQKHFTKVPKEDRAIKVFDVEKKELIATFKNLAECGDELGINAFTLLYALEYKGRNRANKLNKILAFRYVQ